MAIRPPGPPAQGAPTGPTPKSSDPEDGGKPTADSSSWVDRARRSGPQRRVEQQQKAEPIPSLDAVFEAMPAAGAGPAKAQVLSTNLDAWNARWDMLQGATKSIDTSYFI